MQAKLSFNLLDAPWIPARGHDGIISDRGIVDLLNVSGTLEGITDPSPVFEFGMYRFLTAFIIDAFDLQTMDDVDALLKSGAFDKSVINGYVEKWHDRFDLFDEKWPFYQVGPATAKERKSVAEIIPQMPAGTNVIHFHHMEEMDHAVTPATCAKGLVGIPAFQTSGGAGFSPSINGTPPLYILVRGKNLFETLVLNCTGKQMVGPTCDDPPAWRSSTPVEKKVEVIPVSLLKALTWQPRYVHVFPGAGGKCTYTGVESPVLVRDIFFDPGWKFGGSWIDPSCAYRYSDKCLPLRPQEGKAIWRDMGPLLFLKKGEYKSLDGKVEYDKPGLVKQFEALKHLPRTLHGNEFRADVYVVHADKAKIIQWQKDRMHVPMGAMQHARAGSFIQESMEVAEKVEWSLGTAIKNMYVREGDGNKDAFHSLRTVALYKYWNALEPSFKGELMNFIMDLKPDDLDAPQKLKEHRKGMLREICKPILDEVINPLDTDATAMQRQVNAEGLFWGLFYKYTDPEAAAKKAAERRAAKPVKAQKPAKASASTKGTAGQKPAKSSNQRP